MNKGVSKVLSTLFIIFCFSLPVMPAHSAIIDSGNFFSDTESGLDWYDVSFSVNRSYLDISSKFGAGEEFNGWRYASGEEFNNLLSSWTNISSEIAPNRTITTGSDKPVVDLINLFGSTVPFSIPNFSYTLGIIADTDNTNPGQHKVASIWSNTTQNPIDFYNISHQFLNDDKPQINIASFLVRDSVDLSVDPGTGSNGNGTQVSEPKTWLLLGIGLVGLFWSRRVQLIRI